MLNTMKQMIAVFRHNLNANNLKCSIWHSTQDMMKSSKASNMLHHALNCRPKKVDVKPPWLYVSHVKWPGMNVVITRKRQQINAQCVLLKVVAVSV